MPVNHYENFPVASILLPKHLIKAVEAIYAFARSADDIADEGEALPFERIAALSAYQAALDDLEHCLDPMFQRLAKVIEQHDLPLQPFHDLLSAFTQDVTTTRYASFAALLDYCQRSANPVGRLMLALYQATDADNLRDSDAICSALQLINFLQDVAIDINKGRIYLPLEDLSRFGVLEASLEIENFTLDAQWRALMQFQVKRARALLASGAPLALRLPGRIGWELRLAVQGGMRILECIEACGYDVFAHRPQLQKRDWLIILWRAALMSQPK